MKAASIEEVSSYVPALVTRRLAADNAPVEPPVAERFAAAALFIDIAGYTRIAEKLNAELGEKAGAERLAQMLNNYFSPMIEMIEARGGEVVKFAGDALLAVWPIDPGPASSYLDDEMLQTAVSAAASCALALQKRYHQYEALPDLPVSAQIGIGAGHVYAVHLGGALGRIEFLLSGDPMTQMCRAEALGKPGQVILSPQAAAALGVNGRLKPLRDGYGRLRAVHSTPSCSPSLQKLPETARAALKSYIPAAMFGHLEAGLADWRAEIRPVTILFVHLPGYGASIKHPYQRTLPQAQAVMEALQTALYRYEGSINKLNVDDKGISLLAAFGLPPFSHRDDPARGTLAALDIQEALAELGRPSNIGVATGELFCGPIGHPQRREYTIVGDAANLASRLTEACATAVTPTILCDETTWQAARHELRFEKMPPITVKGKTHPVPVYRPQPRNKAVAFSPRQYAVATARLTPIVGRQAERERIAARLRALRQRESGSGGTLLILGEAGIGKSRLAAETLREARFLRLQTFSSQGNGRRRMTPFYAWQPIFWQLLKMETAAQQGLAAQRNHLLRQLPLTGGDRGYPAHALRLAPLLNAILPLDFPENSYTRRLTPERRRRELFLLLQGMLSRLMAETGRSALFLFEDVHLFDADSLELAQTMRRTLAGCEEEEAYPALFLLTARPLSPRFSLVDWMTACRDLLTAPDVERMQLTPLSPDETLTLAQRALKSGRLSSYFETFIGRFGQGNPLFVEELAATLHRYGLARYANGKNSLASAAQRLEELPIPAAARRTALTVIDRLPPLQQTLLKTAAGMGDAFTAQSVAGDGMETAVVEAHLEELAALRLVEKTNDGAAYRFVYRFAQQTVRGMNNE